MVVAFLIDSWHSNVCGVGINDGLAAGPVKEYCNEVPSLRDSQPQTALPICTSSDLHPLVNTSEIGQIPAHWVRQSKFYVPVTYALYLISHVHARGCHATP
jgi:hypothetical protein